MNALLPYYPTTLLPCYPIASTAANGKVAPWRKSCCSPCLEDNPNRNPVPHHSLTLNLILTLTPNANRNPVPHRSLTLTLILTLTPNANRNPVPHHSWG